jgi:hypothetical protein
MTDDIKRQVMDQTKDCVEKISERWTYYMQVLKFRQEVKLSEIIDSFTFPIREFINRNYPLLAEAPPTLFWNMVFLGVEKSKTHSVKDIRVAELELYERYRVK